MNGHFEKSGIFPLSTQPVEGWLSSPDERGGKIILAHADGDRYITVNDSDEGFTFVNSRHEATQFDSHADAAIRAGELIEAARKKTADNTSELVG